MQVYCVKCRRIITSGQYATTRNGTFHYPSCPRPSYLSGIVEALEVLDPNPTDNQGNYTDNETQYPDADFEPGGGESGGGGATGEF